MKKLSERQRKALSRLLRADDRHLPMDRALAKQLERLKLVHISDQVYERRQWDVVVARLPIMQLIASPEDVAKLI